LRRPYTMAEVVERVDAGVPWDIALPEFLDTFYFALRGWPGPDPQVCLDAEPAAVDDPVWHAQLGAIGEHLALRWHQATPAWTRDPSRFLKAPYYPSGTESYKGWYFVQSPTAFRRRMIFTEAEPLRRARLPHPSFYARDLARGYQWTAGARRAVFGSAADICEGGVDAVEGLFHERAGRREVDAQAVVTARAELAARADEQAGTLGNTGRDILR
jgi:hypothetical protein